MLNPRYPAVLVSGNVKTSSCITNALYGALGVLASAPGTMNNFTFGNERYQNYETIPGGSGAGNGFDGTAVVQTHMTNSRVTAPEILEWRYPVQLDSYEISTGSGGHGHCAGGGAGQGCTGAGRMVKWSGNPAQTGRRPLSHNQTRSIPYGRHR